MSKYADMQAASQQARKDWFSLRDRCWQYLATLTHGFKHYCEVPDQSIAYLKWNGMTGAEREYSLADKGSNYALLGAVAFDEEDEFWHLGVRITLTPNGAFPTQWFFFVLCIAEKDGKPQVKLGPAGKPVFLNLTDEVACNNFYEFLFETVLQLFSKPTKAVQQSLGFSYSG